MAERVFKAVAAPPMFLFAPLLPAAASMGLWAVLMMFSQVIIPGGINPLLFIIGGIISHIGLVYFGFKEPHLSTIVQARGQSLKATKSLVKVKEFKTFYAP